METCFKGVSRGSPQGPPAREQRFGVEPEITALRALKRGDRVYEVAITTRARLLRGKEDHWRDGFPALWTLNQVPLRGLKPPGAARACYGPWRTSRDGTRPLVSLRRRLRGQREVYASISTCPASGRDGGGRRGGGREGGQPEARRHRDGSRDAQAGRLGSDRQIKSAPETSAIPVIALSGNAATESKRGPMKAGCSGYLTKPAADVWCPRSPPRLGRSGPLTVPAPKRTITSAATALPRPTWLDYCIR